MRFPRIDLELTSELTSNDLRIDLPHALIPMPSQIPVSVIIPSKTVKSGSVENTVRSPRLAQMRSGVQEAACCRTPWGYLSVHFAVQGVHIRATLRHFDNNYPSGVKMAH